MPKLKRQKSVKKSLLFYEKNFGFKPPHHVILDGTFCKAALKSQVNIGDQLPKYLDAEAKIYTTKCVLRECEALGSLLYGPLKILKQYEVLPCQHKANPFPAGRCLLKKARKTEAHRYFIGTQDPELSEELREIPGSPLLYLAHTAINLEPPSRCSRDKAEIVLADRLAPSKSAQQTIEALKREVFGEKQIAKRKKRKGPKQANPLSCKRKKKVTPVQQTADTKTTSKRKRRKKQLTLQTDRS